MIRIKEDRSCRFGVDERATATLRNVESVLDAETADLHWYGKNEVYLLRKMGHLTLTASAVDTGELLDKARSLRDSLTFALE